MGNKYHGHPVGMEEVLRDFCGYEVWNVICDSYELWYFACL